MVKICAICGKPIINDEELHHVIPVSYGGPVDGITVSLHSSCHFACHKTAESLMAKTVKSKNWFESEEVLKRAAPYVKAIIDAKRDMQEGVNPALMHQPVRRMFQVNLSRWELNRLHKFQRDKGYKSLEKMIEDMLRNLTKF